MRTRRARAILVVAIALAQVVAACGGGSAPTPTTKRPTPTPAKPTATPKTHTVAPSADVVKVFDSVRAACAISQAWGGLSPVPELASCARPVSSWNPIPTGSIVTTSTCGEAWLDTGCGTLYVFGGSNLEISNCPPPVTPGSGCLTSGSVGWADMPCANKLAIATASGTIRLVGTWVSATYVEERQLTLFAVFDGTGEVTAVVDPQNAVVTSPQSIEAGSFWFTVPGDQPADVAGLAPRVAHPFRDLPAIVGELNLQSTFAAITARAAADGKDISGVPAMPVVNVRLGGGELERADARDPVLLAYDWDNNAKKQFAQVDLPVVALAQTDPPRDLRAQSWDFQHASTLATDAGIEQMQVAVIVEESPELVAYGDGFVSMLKELRLAPERVIAVDGDAAAALFNKYIEAGQAVVWLGMH